MLFYLWQPVLPLQDNQRDAVSCTRYNLKPGHVQATFRPSTQVHIRRRRGAHMFGVGAGRRTGEDEPGLGPGPSVEADVAL
jgi:hypothetical protein